ncbi:MAG: peptidoglycan editing factor PgeF [Caulobacteraceae bacterium]
MRPPVVRSPLLEGIPGLRHAFFTRCGGVSRGIYDSLNAGRGSNDRAEDVAENLARIAAAFGARAGDLLTCHQIHSADVAVAEGPWRGARPRADGVVAARRGTIACVLTADCAPVLIAARDGGAVAAVHAGWRGALGGVVEAAVEALRDLGHAPETLVAAVGPCIGPRTYEVGPEFEDRFARAALGSMRFFAGGDGDRRLFDLPAFVIDRLRGAGLADVEWVGRDTFAESDAFFSNRRAVKRGESDYGRMLSAIAREG